MATSILGPLMVDVCGLSLSAVEKARLLRPEIGGVILFQRNFQDRGQLTNLVKEIKTLKSPSLLIAVDQEGGGRVQRFTKQFTILPAMGTLGRIYEEKGLQQAQYAAKQVGWVLATELGAIGIDFSFTPVLDLDWGYSQVIGNRSFHQQAEIVIALAEALIEGLKKAGMMACGKHFPGHGFVRADSHEELPQDERNWNDLWQNDVRVFAELIKKKQLCAIMPAHVCYPKVDMQAAGYSRYWLYTILRKKLDFQGIIISDSLTMAGAAQGLKCIVDRVALAKQAGVNIFLIGNAPHLVDQVLEHSEALGLMSYLPNWQKIRGQKESQQNQETLGTKEFRQACQLLDSIHQYYPFYNMGNLVGEV